MTEINQWF